MCYEWPKPEASSSTLQGRRCGVRSKKNWACWRTIFFLKAIFDNIASSVRGDNVQLLAFHWRMDLANPSKVGSHRPSVVLNMAVLSS